MVREGEIIASMAYDLEGIVDASHVELMAIWKGLFLVEELHISNFIIELDCSPMVRRIIEKKEDLSSLGYLVGTL